MLIEYKVIRKEKLLKVKDDSAYTLEFYQVGIGPTLELAVEDLKSNMRSERVEEERKNETVTKTTVYNRDYSKRPLRPSA